jgi:hypothetical protein
MAVADRQRGCLEGPNVPQCGVQGAQRPPNGEIEGVKVLTPNENRQGVKPCLISINL